MIPALFPREFSLINSSFSDIIDSLRRINKVPKKDWVKVLEGFKEWELRELGENSEWDKDCLDKESIEFIEKNKIKWNWMY